MFFRRFLNAVLEGGCLGSAVASKMNLDSDEVYKEMVDGILPGIQLVPSGVWALGRAQNENCAYIFAG